MDKIFLHIEKFQNVIKEAVKNKLSESKVKSIMLKNIDEIYNIIKQFPPGATSNFVRQIVQYHIFLKTIIRGIFYIKMENREKIMNKIFQYDSKYEIGVNLYSFVKYALQYIDNEKKKSDLFKWFMEYAKIKNIEFFNSRFVFQQNIMNFLVREKMYDEMRFYLDMHAEPFDISYKVANADIVFDICTKPVLKFFLRHKKVICKNPYNSIVNKLLKKSIEKIDKEIDDNVLYIFRDGMNIFNNLNDKIEFTKTIYKKTDVLNTNKKELLEYINERKKQMRKEIKSNMMKSGMSLLSKTVTSKKGKKYNKIRDKLKEKQIVANIIFRSKQFELCSEIQEGKVPPEELLVLADILQINLEEDMNWKTLCNKVSDAILKKYFLSNDTSINAWKTSEITPEENGNKKQETDLSRRRSQFPSFDFIKKKIELEDKKIDYDLEFDPYEW